MKAKITVYIEDLIRESVGEQGAEPVLFELVSHMEEYFGDREYVGLLRQHADRLSNYLDKEVMRDDGRD